LIWIILIAVIVIIFLISSNNSSSAENKSNNKTESFNMDIELPNPEKSNPKDVIEFINDYQSIVIEEVYKKLKLLDNKIPPKLDAAFKEKIQNGAIIKENYLWNMSIEYRKIRQDDLETFANKYSFELKGLKENKYREKLKDCIIYDEVYIELEPENKFDKNAIKVESLDGIIGYVPASETYEVKNIIEYNEYKVYIENIESDIDFISTQIVIYYK
jgi:hypothetical protein